MGATTESPEREAPRRPTLDGLEEKWATAWAEANLYRFDPTVGEVFSIDTPPPTVSGRLHVGHLYSYTHTDVVARFHRMQGRAVFYPMGWDDNGLNVERRVELMLGIRCDPSRPYDPDLVPPGPGSGRLPVSRRNFVEACAEVVEDFERDYRELWTRLGLSVDWTRTYTTIGARAQRVSQAAFLDLVRRDIAYRAEAPTLWDVDYRTAVAQAELEEREVAGAWYRLAFHGPAGTVEVDTTRPELLSACVALVAHPDDDRYRGLLGQEVTTPLFAAPVPVLAHDLADPEKGTGIAMICTFGDVADVTWWRELGLPVRSVVGTEGRILPADWGRDGWPSYAPAQAMRRHTELVGLPVDEARSRIVELLRDSGELVGELRPITHPVKFWENGRRPLEIVTSRQWFVRTMDLRERWLALGDDLEWHPAHMAQRYRDWVEGLTGDWNISRQRFFGVPFPVWYPLGTDGEPDLTAPILPNPDRLPVDPATDVPDGYAEAQRDEPGGFTADPDVMDTWATSSLTPQIVGGWLEDEELYGQVFPYDLRPQAHEIIRTWLFYTVVRSEYLEGRLPWRRAAISGFVVDPDRKKLSKSLGNEADAPHALLDEFGADAVRYWAASSKLGSDTTLDRNRIRMGRRLALKVLNATRFVLLATEPVGADEGATALLDRAMLGWLADVAAGVTAALEDLDHATALREAEEAFWRFCDHYLELVKSRAYGEQGAEPATSAHAALRTGLGAFLRLLAPFLPYATEEAWSWWRDGSVHRAAWPSEDELRAAGATADSVALDVAIDVITEVRRLKGEAGLPLRAPIARLAVTDTDVRLTALAEVEDDVRAAGVVEELVTSEAPGLTITAEFD